MEPQPSLAAVRTPATHPHHSTGSSFLFPPDTALGVARRVLGAVDCFPGEAAGELLGLLRGDLQLRSARFRADRRATDPFQGLVIIYNLRSAISVPFSQKVFTPSPLRRLCWRPWARGGIGRREGLRILWSNPCRFDPCRAHHKTSLSCACIVTRLFGRPYATFRLARGTISECSRHVARPLGSGTRTVW